MMLNMSLIFAGLLSAAIQNTHNMYLKEINARDKYHKNINWTIGKYSRMFIAKRRLWLNTLYQNDNVINKSPLRFLNFIELCEPICT